MPTASFVSESMAATSIVPALGALGSSLVWAYGSSIYSRWTRRTGAVEVGFARSLIAAPVFWAAAVLVCDGQALAGVSHVRLLWLGVSTLCSYGFGDLCFYWATTLLGTSSALAIASIYPMWASLLGVLALGEPATGGRVAGTALCVAGVMWLVLLARDGDPSVARGASPGAPRMGRAARVSAGMMLALLASLAWAANTYTIRRGATGISLFTANALRFTMALGILLPGLVVQRVLDRRSRRATDDAREALVAPRWHLVRFAGTALIEAFGGGWMLVYSLAHGDLSVAAPLSALAPLFAVPIALILGTERFRGQRVCATAMAVLGTVILVLSR